MMRLHELLNSLYTRPVAWVERYFGGRFWWLKVSLLCTFCTVIISFPDVRPEFETMWADNEEQISQPFTPKSYGIDSHQSKKTFRLTMPIIGHVTGLHMPGLIVLQWLMGFFFFGLGALLLERITRDRITAVLVMLGLAFTYTGNACFYDVVGWFDAPGIFFLLVAMLSRNAVGIGIATFVACWSDERAMVASSLVMLFHLNRICGLEEPWRLRKAISSGFAVWIIPVVWGIVLAIRWWLNHRFGLTTPIGEGTATGLAVLRDNYSNLAMGILTSVEFFWLPILIAALLFFKNRQFLSGSALMLAVGGLVIISLMVYDITRSGVYIYPGIFVAYQMLSAWGDVTSVRKFSLLTAFLCLFFPTHFIINSPIWITPIFPKVFGL